MSAQIFCHLHGCSTAFVEGSASGRAAQKIQAAEGYAVERVNNAQGDAGRFIAVYEQYRKAPQVTRTRLYLETLAAILPEAERKLIIDEKVKGVLPLLQLGKTMEVKP